MWGQGRSPTPTTQLLQTAADDVLEELTHLDETVAELLDRLVVGHRDEQALTLLLLVQGVDVRDQIFLPGAGVDLRAVVEVEQLGDLAVLDLDAHVERVHPDRGDVAEDLHAHVAVGAVGDQLLLELVVGEAEVEHGGDGERGHGTSFGYGLSCP